MGREEWFNVAISINVIHNINIVKERKHDNCNRCLKKSLRSNSILILH